MECRDVSYEDELIEFLQGLFPDSQILSAVMRATIEGGKLVLPEVYVYFEQAPGRAERRISSHIDNFINQQATREGASYDKTLRRIIVEDIKSLEDLSDQATDNWY